MTKRGHRRLTAAVLEDRAGFIRCMHLARVEARAWERHRTPPAVCVIRGAPAPTAGD